MEHRSILALRFAALTLASALAACASPEWTRPDLSFAQVEDDELACQKQAARELDAQGSPLYGSLSDLYGQNFQPPSLRAPRMRAGSIPGPQFDIDPVRRILDGERIADACMRAKGYTLRI